MHALNARGNGADIDFRSISKILVEFRKPGFDETLRFYNYLATLCPVQCAHYVFVLTRRHQTATAVAREP
jgi:hypothetical protein